MSGIIGVETLTGPRFATALELLNVGGGFRFEGVAFRFEPAGVLCCVVESSWSPERVSRATAEEDIAFAEAVLHKVRNASPEFAASTADKTSRFEVIYDDGGSSFLLAWREADGLTMAAGFGGAG